MTHVRAAVEQGDLFAHEIIPLRLAISAMRDSGYKNTAYALAELIDNAAQAGAGMIEVLCLERRAVVKERERSRLHKIAVLDNGSGMDAPTLRMALQFGNGTRLDDRSGIGRFGMGLPNASISQAARVDVWTWQNGPSNALWTYLDLEEIDAGSITEVPEPRPDAVPHDWRGLSDHVGSSGTLVVWSKLDQERLTWKRAPRALDHAERIVGRVYRRLIADGSVAIRLYAKEEGGADAIVDREASLNDPLYLQPLPSLPAPFDRVAMFEEAWPETHRIEFQGEVHEVLANYSIAKADTVGEAGTVDRGNTEYGRHAGENVGVSVLRAGRELILDSGWCIGYDPRERWWGAEVEFPPTLDEVFGVSNNKQAATHFSELARTDWRELREEPDEEFLDVVSRLKDDGDHRGWLLELSDSINRNLKKLRGLVKAQGASSRSSRKKRHGEADDVTNAVNTAWKARSKDNPVEGDKEAPDLVEVRNDLTENKGFSTQDADEIVSLIRDAQLRVVFLEADFPDPFQLFNVEMKGNITEITFNRLHPGFDDLFGTVALDDPGMSELTPEEITEKLVRAVNATKVVFAGWARYEREAGIDRTRKLQRVRLGWGQMAAQFLEPDEDL